MCAVLRCIVFTSSILALGIALDNTAFVSFNGKLVVKAPDAKPGYQHSSSRVVFHGETAQYFSLVRANGSFAVMAPPGQYLVEVVSTEYYLEPERLEIKNKSVKCKYWEDGKGWLVLPLEETRKYFNPRPGWDVWGMLKNPMIIMLGVTAVMTIGIPKLMSLDPEGMKEMNRGSQVVKPDGSKVYPENLVPKWQPSPVVQRR